jgi:hypothetical protein
MRQARYAIEAQDQKALIISDLGPWDRYPTVTNAAEGVVQELVSSGSLLPGMRLFCYDSDGQLDELLVENGAFAGFRCGVQP